MPVGVLEAAAGTKGDNGRLLGAAGDGGLFLGFGVLETREEMAAEVNYEQRANSTGGVSYQSTKKGNKVPAYCIKPRTRSGGSPE